MEPENTISLESKKKFLTIALIAVLAIAAVVFIKKWYASETAEVKTAPAAKKVYTQEEKMKILTDMAQTIPKDTTSQVEKMRILSNIAKRAPAATATSTAEKLKILQSLAANAGQ
ncbi:MAG: hypothetical protein HZB11_00745 [Candidatus Yonathbacteria bacterium]|nr:hypothetical protein [Candidatus Yonathbacteria bacterium]